VPEVSVGMPVYNAERFIAPALDSLLGQSFSDFELIISDNASTDATGEICRRYAAADARIRYLRQERNLGAARNWNLVVELAHGRYFKWASANDCCEPQMLQLCVAALRQDASLALCYGHTALMSDDGVITSVYDRDPGITETSPALRFRRAIDDLHMNNAQAGLIRLDLLRQTAGDRDYAAGDMVLMAELALLGGYRLLPQVLLQRRMGQQSATKFLSAQALQAFFTPGRGRGRLLSWRRFADYAGVALRAPISWHERLRALAVLPRRMYWARRELLGDLVAALRQAR
jgi:glycosyltransferase involved in cell wall biosynthesis